MLLVPTLLERYALMAGSECRAPTTLMTCTQHRYGKCTKSLIWSAKWLPQLVKCRLYSAQSLFRKDLR
jgi:hypothetical protein